MKKALAISYIIDDCGACESTKQGEGLIKLLNRISKKSK